MDWAHIQNTPEHADAAVEALQESGIRGVFAHGWPQTDPMRRVVDSDEPRPGAGPRQPGPVAARGP
ncbi:MULTISPECIES: hypothetical protein [unclassified Nonomuraea]|uniref:hypothetical protein n=1 Tax=unclassified Nonomuraea TaxID=2593643 RepID=UPI0033C4497D